MRISTMPVTLGKMAGGVDWTPVPRPPPERVMGSRKSCTQQGKGVALPDGLDKLLDDGIIDDVKGRLLSGKEASVFIVERRGDLIAAKVYKAREQRTFKATASYTEGRNQTRNSRDKRAMSKRTSYGRELLEESWRDMEYRALSEAFHAGVRVPEPILLYEDVLLMELLVDEEGLPAPRLADFELPAEVASLLHREIYGQVRLLLAAGKIHGDLSAFNILITYKGATLIDLPQVVDAAGNSQAPDILRRDLRNVTEHLARFDPRLVRFIDCGEALWRHYSRGSLDAATEPEEGRRGDRGPPPRRERDGDRGRHERVSAAGHGGGHGFSSRGAQQGGRRPNGKNHGGPPEGARPPRGSHPRGHAPKGSGPRGPGPNGSGPRGHEPNGSSPRGGSGPRGPGRGGPPRHRAR